MGWELSALGAVLSMLLMLSLVGKWKLPGRAALAGAAAAAVVAALSFCWLYPLCGATWELVVAIFGQMAVALVLALALIMVCFWRDPDRVPPEGEGVVLSAADGEVVYVRIVDEGSAPLVTKGRRGYLLSDLTGTSFLASATYVIGVEMSFLNVHVNRCPIAGQVTFLKHIGGKFISLRKEEAAFTNARFTTIIESPALAVVVAQIASRLVRRVESYLAIGETVSMGQRLGVIKLGSLVAVVLPRREDVVIEVKPGDRVTAGVSVLAHYEVNGERTEH
ncbi:MAG: phosphatidylserine decarboxylase [Anaerolineae bacterium]|nr:phosphatidylserine decarboxylase [Anaerolineae bacterium]